MQFFENNQLPFFRFESLAVDHALFTRQGGVSPTPFASLNLSVSVADDKANVYANRRRAYGLFGRDTHSVVHAHLVHGNRVARVSSADNGSWVSEVDGIMSNEPGCALTMNFADCSPILLYDPQQQAIGLGHAGWQGAVKDLAGALVRGMGQAFGSAPAGLQAAIGPSIGPCCYEVGETVISAVQGAFTDWEGLFVPGRSNRPHFNLPEANRRNLQRAGVGHIEMAECCTACHTDLFFSHRAEKGLTGRFGMVMVLPSNLTL